MNYSKLLTVIAMAIIVTVIAFKATLSEPVRDNQVDLDEVEKRIIATQVAYDKAESDSTPPPFTGDIDSCAAGTTNQSTIKRIVVHHTVVSGDVNTIYQAISRSHEKRWRNGLSSYNISDPDFMNKVKTPSWYYTMYHRLIGSNWTITWDRQFDQVGRWSKNNCNNIETFHIALVWNFQIDKPTEAQYKTLNEVISIVRSKYWEDIPVFWHGQLEKEATACPGKFFDYSKLVKIPEKVAEPIEDEPQPKKVYVQKPKPAAWSDKKFLGTFSLTRYYSCDPNQTKWLPWEVNIWQDNYAACNKRQFNWDPDNTMPKDWVRYTNADAGIAVACPKEYYGKTLIIENRWEVKCRDVWSAITAWRIDVYVWIWDRAIDNRNRFPTGSRKIRLKY